jgi:hypothetical protein
VAEAVAEWVAEAVAVAEAAAAEEEEEEQTMTCRQSGKQGRPKAADRFG